MPRLTAARRLGIMSGAIAYAEDRRNVGVDRVPIGEVAEHLAESIEAVAESLAPLEWLEFEVPGDIVDLLDAVRVVDDHLVVAEAWWRRLAVLSPGEAARLYTKAAVAASLDDDPSMPLRTAMAKLRSMVAEITVVEGDAPPRVDKLRKARDAGEQVIVDIEGHDRTLVTSRARFNVIAVFRQGETWTTTLQPVVGEAAMAAGAGDPVTIPVARITSLIPGGVGGDPVDAESTVIDPASSLDVTIEYPADRDWILDPFETSGVARVSNDRLRCTVEAWGVPEIKTLLLRLGPSATLLDPPELRDLRGTAAGEVLSLYR